MNETAAVGALIGFVIVFWLIILSTVVISLIALWKIYQKAGYEGWEAIIPIYNMYILLKIVGKPGWWLILMFVPIANAIFGIWTYNMLSKSFGKDEGYTIGMIILPFVFLPMLGFGKARYLGPYGDQQLFNEYQSRTKFDFEGPAYPAQ